MNDINPNAQRFRELLKTKRRLLTRMRKHRKALAKDRVEKKRVNEEITRLRKSGFAFAGMTPSQAATRVSNEIQAVTPEDIYPKDLERKFDKLERTTAVVYKKGKVDVSDIEDSGPETKGKAKDDEDVVVALQDDGVLDLSETDDAEDLSEPADDDGG